MNPSAVYSYPIDAFHSLVQNAAEEVCRHVQAPHALVGTAFLTTLSVSCQGLVDICLPTGQVRPVSLNVMAIAESGERKSGVDSLVAEPIYKYDQRRFEEYKSAKKQFELDHRVWKSVDIGLRRRLMKLAQNQEDIDDICRQLHEHGAKEPVKPRLRTIVRHNITERAILEALHGDGESIALMSDEGEVILKGGGMTRTGLLNKAWDGTQVLRMDRANGESLHAHNPRLTTAYMVHPLVIKKYCERNGEIARGSGHWARYLLASPVSTQGTRYMSYMEPQWQYLPKFHQRVTELLEEYGRSMHTGTCVRRTLEFSEEAKIKWIDAINSVEADLRPWGYLHDVKDFASKAIEITSRVAALFHWFSGQEGKISIDTFDRALKIVGWHLQEFKRIFSPQCTVSEAQIDANVLGRYLQTQLVQTGYMNIPKNHVLRNGPIRPKQRLEIALDLLVAHGQVCIQLDRKRRGFIMLNPNHFGYNSPYAYSGVPQPVIPPNF